MSKSLLYYNPSIVSHASNHHLPGMRRFSQFFKLYNPNVVLIDRTGTIKTPVRSTSLFPIPTVEPFSKTFEQICNERACELIGYAEHSNVPIYIFWSGGIDSTLLLVSLLKNTSAAQRKRLVVLLTQDSINENPRFFAEHINGKLRAEPSSMFPYLLGGEHLIVGGEHNDQLFGADVVGKFMHKFGNHVIHQPYSRELFKTYFEDLLPEDPSGIEFYLNMYERMKDSAPVPINTNFDLLWWINFSLKWQSVFIRILTFTAERNAPKLNREYIRSRYFHFYNTDDFQRWSLHNQDKKIKDEWRTYKWVCKDIIYQYTKDADYRDNKTKRGSLFHLLLQREAFNFIDESVHLSRDMDPKEYYLPNNDFCN